MAYLITKLIWKPLLKWIFIKQISGTENLPRKTPFLIVANHESYIDPFLVAIPVLERYDKKIRFVAWEKLYHDWRVFFVVLFGAIKQNGSVDKALAALKRGEIVGIFPEGGRTHTGKLQKIEHSGAGVLAVLGKVPVVPIAIEGGFEVWSWKRRFPKFKKSIEIRIGKPISVKRYYNKKLTKTQYLKLTRQFMKGVGKLLR